MKIDRRIVIRGFGAALLAPRGAVAASVTDATGRVVTAPDRLARVYPAGPPAAVAIYTLAPDLLIGWLEPIGPQAREFLLPAIAARPLLPRLTARGSAVNLDAVAALKPDLILDIGDVNAGYAALAAHVQNSTGIPYALLDGHLGRVPATYRALGRLLGRGDRAETLARSAEKTIATATARSAAVPAAARPRVYYARDKSGLRTGFGASMITEPIAFLGARNVAAELHGAHGMATIEQVRALDPEIVIAAEPEFAASLRSDAAWADIAAVKSGRIYLEPRLPFGWTDFPPAVNRLIGLWWLGKIFYPDRFPEDIKALARDFYALFYQVTPSAAQIERLMAGSA